MYQARRASLDALIAVTAAADGATAAALRSAPRRAAASPYAVASRLAPLSLSVALLATAGAIVLGARTSADAAPQPADAAALPVRADQLSRADSREAVTEIPDAAASTAPVAAAWSAQYSAVAATWYAQSALTVRAAASGEAAEIGSLKAGDKVEITERVVGEFREVLFSGKIGWVATDEVGEKAPLPGAVAKSPGKTSSTRVLGLTVQAMGVYNAVMGQWGGPINSVGGYRASSLSDHQFGRAIDFMLTPGAESALGWTIAKYLAANAGSLGVDHIIFEQKIWTPANPTWRPMANRGSITANHFDHVHVSVER